MSTQQQETQKASDTGDASTQNDENVEDADFEVVDDDKSKK